MSDGENAIIVVGGGWAGLACAVQLTARGHAVTLLESARQLGGRARRVAFDDQGVDNGQHVMLGAYHQTLALLKQLNIPLEKTLQREMLDLYLLRAHDHHFQFRMPHLFSPLNLLFGLLGSKGFSIRDRWSAFLLGLRLFGNAISTEEDISVAQLLSRYNQTDNVIRALWEPICLASLNTPIEEASSDVFIRVLHDSFCRSHRDADMIIPRVDLGRLLPDPAFDYIEQHGGFVHLSQRVTELLIEKRHVRGIKCDDNRYDAAQVVLAIPPHACQPLLKPHSALHDIAYNMSGYDYHPICTIYLQYPPSVQTDRPIQGLLGTTSQWIVDRRVTGQPGLIAAVISGPGPHMQLENDELGALVQDELQQLFPHWPAANAVQVIREKRATFNCRVGIETLRPTNRTPVQGLWLAGDYTNTGYPATIESAVISGQRAADKIHQEVTKA
ncbi:MAG: FAD-dependent oxidoreductase [Gammaproteobacteria bacterium]|nr:FAD-dependent oxidoreductase [Gammaproteobacteria bacterium]